MISPLASASESAQPFGIGNLFGLYDASENVYLRLVSAYRLQVLDELIAEPPGFSLKIPDCKFTPKRGGYREPDKKRLAPLPRIVYPGVAVAIPPVPEP